MSEIALEQVKEKRQLICNRLYLATPRKSTRTSIEFEERSQKRNLKKNEKRGYSILGCDLQDFSFASDAEGTFASSHFFPLLLPSSVSRITLADNHTHEKIFPTSFSARFETQSIDGRRVQKSDGRRSEQKEGLE